MSSRSKVREFKPFSKYQPKTMVLWVAIFAAIGVVTLFIARAAGLTAFLEPENGTRTALATVGNDTQASGGRYVQFSSPAVTGQSLTVNAANFVRPFDRKMKGMGFGNWTFNFGRPYIGQIQGLGQLMGAIDPGLLRYAGGLKANYIGFDRTQTTPVFDSAWTFNGQTYYERYGTNELASLDSFAKSINAEVMIQVNMSNNDPSMWADLVRYAKERGWTSFKYYEFSNELDLESFNNSADKIDPTTYANRLAAYQTAMLAVDSTIKIVGGVPATASDIMYNGYGCCGNNVSQYITKALPAARSAGRDLSVASFHWYQGGATSADVFRWAWGNLPSSTEWWRESYARDWSGGVGPWIRNTALSNYPNTAIGISELGVDSDGTIPNNGNHIAALWFSDVLGRLAYNGIDWVTEWASYAGQVEYFSLMYPNDDTPTPTLNVRPTYDAYLMYSKYFGDQMVQSGTYDETKISIWASKDTKDPNKLKLRITNLTGTAINAPIVLSGFTTSGGSAYVMSSSNPLDTSTNSTLGSAPTTINGIKINAANVAASLSSIQPVTLNVSGTTFNYTVPAYSSAAIVLSGTFQ